MRKRKRGNERVLFLTATPMQVAPSPLVHQHMKTLLLVLILTLPAITYAQKTKPLEYKGTLEAGKTYRGKVNFGSAYGMTLTPWPKLPHHHSVMYRWPNVSDFPALDPDKDFGVRTIVFKVVNTERRFVRKYLWTITFTIEILKVEPVMQKREGE